MTTPTSQQHRIFTCLAAALFALASVGAVSADFTADCIYDGYVAMGGMVYNTSNSYLLPGNPDSPPQGSMETFGYAFLKFDDADLPAAAVDHAYLQLDVICLQDGMTWPVQGTGEVGAFAVTADVTTITGGTAGAFREHVAAVAADSISMTGEGLITLDVTEIVNDWIVSGDNYGLVLASPGGLMPRLHSSESTAGIAPLISSVPEPASVLLLGCAVVGLASRRAGRSR